MNYGLSTVVALATLLIADASHGAGVFEKEISCYQPLISASQGVNLRIDEGSLLIPGKKNSQRGFYVFTGPTSYFCKFPSKPAETSWDSNTYYLELAIPGEKTSYLSYQDPKWNNSLVGFGTSSSPSSINSGKYQKANCVSYLSDESRKVIADELEKRITTVKKTTAGRQSVPRRPISAQDAARIALETCSQVQGKVGELALLELKSLTVTTTVNSDQPSGGKH